MWDLNGIKGEEIVKKITWCIRGGTNGVSQLCFYLSGNSGKIYLQNYKYIKTVLKIDVESKMC